MRNDALATISDVERVAEKTYHNSKKLSQNDRQRRDEFVDLYGIEFSKNGAANSPAKFHVSVSGDAAYMERFQFKLVIEPFQINSELALTSTSLSVSGSSFSNLSVSPNPHNHQLVAGVTNINVSGSDFDVYCEGIKITEYLRAQVVAGGWNWFDGEGVYPSTDLEQSFDLIEVACDMEAEADALDKQGHADQAEQKRNDASKILRQGWKPIELHGSQPFGATMILYLKYQHMNR